MWKECRVGVLSTDVIVAHPDETPSLCILDFLRVVYDGSREKDVCCFTNPNDWVGCLTQQHLKSRFLDAPQKVFEFRPCDSLKTSWRQKAAIKLLLASHTGTVCLWSSFKCDKSYLPRLERSKAQSVFIEIWICHRNEHMKKRKKSSFSRFNFSLYCV